MPEITATDTGWQDLSAAAKASLAALLADRDPAQAARDELTAAGWIRPDGSLEARRARLMGTDIGGTKAQSLLCDLDGAVLAEVSAPTAGDGVDALVEQIAGQRDALLDRAGAGEALVAAGIGLPGSIDPVTGSLHRVPNVGGLDGRDLRALLVKRLALPVALENDVNMAAIGEHSFGMESGQGGRDDGLVFLALGTGIGMGTILRGEVLRGRTGAAGEIAWLPVGGDPFDPATFRSGALESAISSRALLLRYADHGGQGRGTLRELFAQPHDPAFDAVLDDLAGLLAQAVLAVCAILDPGRIVLGGSVGARPEVRDRLAAKLALCMADPPEIRTTRLGGRAGALGAVRTARLRLARSLA